MDKALFTSDNQLTVHSYGIAKGFEPVLCTFYIVHCNEIGLHIISSSCYLYPVNHTIPLILLLAPQYHGMRDIIIITSELSELFIEIDNGMVLPRSYNLRTPDSVISSIPQAEAAAS